MPHPAPTRRRRTWGRIFLLVDTLLFLVFLAFWLDAPVIQWVAENRSGAWKAVAKWCSRVGDWPFLALGSVVFAGWAWGRGRRRWMMLACLMLAATLLAGAIVNPLRILTGRARPNTKVEKGWHGLKADGRWIAGKHAYSAFPSAHTTIAAAFFGVLIIAGPRWMLVAWLPVFAVGWSRVYLGVHHPSDVVAGAILGYGCAWVTCRSPGLRWWLWRAASAACGRRTAWPRGFRVAVLAGRRSSRCVVDGLEAP